MPRYAAEYKTSAQPFAAFVGGRAAFRTGGEPPLQAGEPRAANGASVMSVVPSMQIAQIVSSRHRSNTRTRKTLSLPCPSP